MRIWAGQRYRKSPDLLEGLLKTMSRHQTLDALEEGYFRDHPEEIDVYLHEIFDLYAFE